MNDIRARLQQGDKKALEKLYQQYHNKVYRFVLRFSKNESLAEEVTQMLFLKIWEKRQQLSTVKALEAQIFTIAKHLTIDVMRAEARKRQHETNFANRLEDSSNFTENTVLANDFKDALETVINELPPRRGKIFRMNRLEGKSYREIAEQLSISPKTVENQMSQALKDVRSKLAAFFNLF